MLLDDGARWSSAGHGVMRGQQWATREEDDERHNEEEEDRGAGVWLTCGPGQAGTEEEKKWGFLSISWKMDRPYIFKAHLSPIN